MAYSSINRVTIVGNLTHDPELRELDGGRSVCRLRIACSGRRRAEDGSFEARPNYFDVAVFGPQGENVHRYLQKGSALAVDGRLEWSAWEASDGQQRQAVTIVAEAVQFLNGSRGRTADEDGQRDAAQDLALAG